MTLAVSTTGPSKHSGALEAEGEAARSPRLGARHAPIASNDVPVVGKPAGAAVGELIRHRSAIMPRPRGSGPDAPPSGRRTRRIAPLYACNRASAAGSEGTLRTVEPTGAVS